MQDAGDAAADRAARARDQCGLPGEFKHRQSSRTQMFKPRAALKRAMSSGVPIEDALRRSAMRLIKPASTLPDADLVKCRHAGFGHERNQLAPANGAGHLLHQRAARSRPDR